MHSKRQWWGVYKSSFQQVLCRSRYSPPDKRAIQSATKRVSREDESNPCRDGPLDDVPHGNGSYLVGEAIMTSVYTINRIPNTASSNTNPCETLYGSKPDLSYFRVFGCTGYLRVEDCKRTKWDSKANKCIYLGYSDTSKGYRV